MNKFIVDHVKNTKDAVLVDKHLGNELNTKLFQVLFRNRTKELIKVAKGLEKESKKETKTVDNFDYSTLALASMPNDGLVTLTNGTTAVNN